MHTELASDEVSRHKCLIYDGHPSEQLSVVIPFLMDGLQSNWRCLYLGSPDAVRMLSATLAARGIDIRRETRRGALVLSSDRGHLVGGAFDPGKMIDGLCALVDSAVADGFQGLCATGDMRWELGTDEDFDRLLEYEARLEQVFREKPLRGLCQYHRDVIPQRAVREALVAHRSVYIGEVLNRENLFYIPPELLLEARDHVPSSGSKHGEWMCQQIIRVQNAEHNRDKALAALKESEAQQRRLAGQLAEMNRDLERRVAERTAELEVANRQLEAYSYSVSHDLRSPLQAIIGFSEILVEECGESLDEKGRKHLGRVRTNAKRMGELIEGLLSLGRVDKTDLNREAVDLSALAEEIAREIREGEPRREVELVIQAGLHAFGDQVLLRVVLSNLLANAWKFTSKCADPRIEVGKTGEKPYGTVFFVRDNGAGFEMKYAQRLFGAFQRLHSREEFPGTGVGLATVQRIIARHGGKIWAESQPGLGATFFFTLPGEAFDPRCQGISRLQETVS